MIKIVKALLASLAITSFIGSASAQTQVTPDMLRMQPGLAEQLNNLAPVTPGASDTGGVPTSNDASTANAQDVDKNNDLLIQSTGKRSSAPSVVQRYFQILTGRVLDVYGAQEFSQQQDNKLLFFNTVGKNYRLAPGDVIRVTLRGLSQSNQTYKIGRDGNIILNDLPPVPVSGLTIAELEQSLLETLQLDDASASTFVSLETARLITVQVSGAVNTPRTLAVPAYTPLSRVLAYAGGVKANGSLRNIVLRDRDGSVEEVDFYDFLRSPVGSNDPLVTDASRIFVPNQGATVAAVGFVARPGIYELPANADTVSVEELLALSGTSILPPGLVLEIKYFDESGISKTRTVAKTDTIRAGEVLNLRFVQTRLQEAVTVMGAVLDEYSMASSAPIGVREVLKNGATLERNARLDFALIINQDGSSRAINLERALQNDAETLPVGSTLVIFDQQTYQRLVNADPNKTNDPIVAALSQTEVAELYLNGARLAFIPPTQGASFASTLQPYYRLTPATNLDLAILEAPDGATNAVSLRSLIQGTAPFRLSPGTKIHLFETSFLTNFVKQLDNRSSTDPVVLLEFGRSAPLARLLSRAQVLRVKLDGELMSILPKSEAQVISNIVDVLGIETSLSTLADLVELDLQTTDRQPSQSSLSLTVDFNAPLPNAQAIGFWSLSAFQRRLARPQEDDLKQLNSIGVSVFVDYKLQTVLSPSAINTPIGPLEDIVLDARTYPLFSLIRNFDLPNARWETKPTHPKDLLASADARVGEGSQLYLFTRDYIGRLLNGNARNQFSTLKQTIDAETTEDTEARALDRSADMIEAVSERSTSALISDADIRFDASLLQSYSRFIGGAVQNPGRYPVAGAVSLGQLLDVTGGVLESAELSKISIQYLKVQGSSLVKSNLRTVSLSNVGQAYKISLSGRYYVTVPSLINEASTGVVTLRGEVMRPGQYIIARDDTLHDLIKRAGGLSPVAYPLGAVFSRGSLKAAEREYNDLLASQVEEAVLQVSSSDTTNAQEQVDAVLGYARQLRSQDPAGRLAVNVTLADPQAPVYLESGDVLSIPKRPAHVSIIGAVNRDTIASFTPGKTLSAYLASAGGASRVADLKRAYLLLPNGESTPLSRNTLIPAGSAIVVPPKTDRLSALGLTDLISRVMGNIATSVLAINNVR